MPALLSRGGEFMWAIAGHEFFTSEAFIEDPSCSGAFPNERKADPCPLCASLQVTGIQTPVLDEDWVWWNLSMHPEEMILLEPRQPVGPPWYPPKASQLSHGTFPHMREGWKHNMSSSVLTCHGDRNLLVMSGLRCLVQTKPILAQDCLWQPA